ncbi:MAG: TRIC cation channel family protein [Lachnospiraceae bacterium]|nr:TRIC cation channel family protein [Lachnospiraceae bacterium]
MSFEIISIMDYIGTIAFAISGAMVAIEKEMDLFGIMILALVTATGGGFIRDLTIGTIPPMVFRDPTYMILSFITAVCVFLIVLWIRRHQNFTSPEKKAKLSASYQKLLLITDSLGLAAFTVDGVFAGRRLSAPDDTNAYLVIFLGVITGVGGGVIRDIFAAQKPYIFVRHIYAVASLAGAAAAAFLPLVISDRKAQGISFVLVLLIRYLAAHYKWNLPRIPQS